ncbi:Translation Initiation factor eIF- 4e [Carpediemonas membranifera]|uniref:Translation Initiation factor eIF- 4e n=1 Tax=Carpediemonas membranifera TaxID=201153 RepID=A0A8J6B885_9EUKA|nr:Translation Initiation factor eIF- 4e [Carpediemonas membranifera]|eukprot:KAG9396289.1 Translation Initiation factor eIF- 4e [Carpediemonas membranifera]
MPGSERSELRDKWAIYELDGKTWQPVKHYEFCTAEEFWLLWNNLPELHSIETTFYVMKRNIAPQWESEDNAFGGRLECAKSGSMSSPEQNNFFCFIRDTILRIIGATIPEYDSVTGFEFQVSQKKNTQRFRVWIKHCPETVFRAVGQEMMIIQDHNGADELVKFCPFYTIYQKEASNDKYNKRKDAPPPRPLDIEQWYKSKPHRINWTRPNKEWLVMKDLVISRPRTNEQ